ncbi:G/U mismatch-specific uracil-DNA glycosylase [Georgenia soli]|uniref:G/U mismatch-specific uracil-DNA glycosylase n=1 Tax=Georgenia soli TaxID=638953 RepID=A0A2A9ENZ2_9MICO|nr:G/U mismatch-specific DNA glycosylase [Georgenia soli]PFG39960.1 G/U mismatch-specific uracil-DNA glycosylase [Georgenia soli]
MGRTKGRADGQATAPRPSREELEACVGRGIPPVIAPGLRILMCGINPGLYSAWTGHHFARPGNRFWPALHRSGLTPRLLAPAEQGELLEHGLGITNVVNRATATAAELSITELREGGERLAEEVRTYAPAWLAVLGITAYRAAFAEPRAALGPQERTLGSTRVWVLPNPSGLNAHFQLPELAEKFGELRAAAARD